MPRPKRGPYLYWHKTEEQWVIREHPKTFIRTGCGAGENKAAEERLAEFISRKWEPDTTQKRAGDTYLDNVIDVYLEVKLPKTSPGPRANELNSMGERLVAFWGDMTVSQIVGSTCREYTQQSTTQSMARHDLEILRAAVNLYQKEFGLDVVPKFTLPPKGVPRQGWLTRQMAAQLIRAARSAKNDHLVRFIIIGIYTGTRLTPILNMQWMPNTTGGYFDLEKGLMYRAPEREKQTKKRKPTAVIPYRLLFWLKRWKTKDTHEGAQPRHIVNWRGKGVGRINKAFNAAVKEAGLPDWVTPHTLRHTAITWAMHEGKPVNTVVSFFGVTEQVLTSTYWHHHPMYQEEMRTIGRNNQ